MATNPLLTLLRQIESLLSTSSSPDHDDVVLEYDIESTSDLSLVKALKKGVDTLTETLKDKVSSKSFWDLACAFWEKHMKFNDSLTNMKDDFYATRAEISNMTCSLLSTIPESDLTTENKLCVVKIRIKNVGNWISSKKVEKARNCLESIWNEKDFLITMLKNSSLPEYLMEESVQILMELCSCKFQVGYLEQDEDSCYEACRIAKSVIFTNSVNSNLSLEISYQFCHTLLSILVPDLETCDAETCHTHLSFAFEILEQKCELNNKGVLLLEAKVLGSMILGAQCLLYLRTRQLELASRSFSQFQCMNQDLTEKTEISPPLSILQQILHFKIHLQSGQHQLTEEELSQLLDNQGSKNELILYLIDEYITWAPANIEILVSLFAKRTSPDPEILVKTAACILRKEQVSESDDQVVLSLLNNASNRESILRQQILMKSCYALLWNRGVIQFDSKQFTSATIFFEASYSYSAAQDRAKTARAVGLCLLGSRNYSRALEWIALCHSVAGEHLEVADCFVSFKLALLRCDCEACEDSINLMIKCHDFEPHIMKIACQEAISSGMHKLAKKTLRKLHQMSLENASILQGLTESAILRCLIKCSLEILQIVCSNEEDYNEIINEICSEFDLVVKRLDSVGFNTFFGVFSDSGDVSVFAELEWFSFQSWNLALSSAEKEDHEKATVLFASSAMLMSNHPQPIHKQNSHTKTAYLLAASSALKIHDLNIDKNEAKSKSSLQTAKELIKRNKAIKEKDITDSDFLELFLDFEFVKRSGQMESLKRLIEGSRKSRSISGEHLIKLGMSFKDVAYQDPEISRMIFRIALQKLTAESSPRFDRIFMVQRMLIQQTYDLSQKLTLFQEALQLIQFHKRCASSFPAKEIHWLVASCWNQGLHDMRFNRREMALNFMTTSISLIEYCPELNERKESMLQEIERIKLSN